MTLLYERQIDGPCTHALVIGVGDYPSAKYNRGVLPQLGEVEDMASAADSAMRICDWLYENRDRLAAPLASLDVLISSPADSQMRYQWQHPQVFARYTIAPATTTEVEQAGRKWMKRLAVANSTAFLFACGHGASHGLQPAVFLSDLAEDEVRPWSHINVGDLGLALQMKSTVTAAFLFVDACGQYMKDFELVKGDDCKFYAARKSNPATESHSNVLLLAAAAEGHLAWEGSTPDSPVMLGRFTRMLLMCLDGASTRLLDGEWVVETSTLLVDMTSLRTTFFSHWPSDERFVPTSPLTPNLRLPIVFPQNQELPLVIKTRPDERLADCKLIICDENNSSATALQSREPGPGEAWITLINASEASMFVFARSLTHAGYSTLSPREPKFDARINVNEL